jgi:hypothetical protein
MDNKDELKICDNWEDDWENCDEIEAKLKANIEETKKKELQQLVDKAEEELIEDLFLHNTGVNPRKPPLLCYAMRHDLVQHGGKAPVNLTPLLLPSGEGEFRPTKGWVENNLKKEDNEQKLREKKKKQLALKKRQEELFGDASLDAIQDQYCDFEDRY